MNTLIAYFSHDGENYYNGGFKVLSKGNAQILAEKCKKMLESDIFCIDTVKTYPFGYQDCCAVAKLEQQGDVLPELSEYLPNIDAYDRIVLVYPCWWGTMPQPVFTFLNHYDFSNKKIYPICTHEGSGMGRSETDLSRFSKNVHKGLAIQGCKAEKADEELKKYLKDNNLL